MEPVPLIAAKKGKKLPKFQIADNIIEDKQPKDNKKI